MISRGINIFNFNGQRSNREPSKNFLQKCILISSYL